MTLRRAVISFVGYFLAFCVGTILLSYGVWAELPLIGIVAAVMGAAFLVIDDFRSSKSAKTKEESRREAETRERATPAAKRTKAVKLFHRTDAPVAVLAGGFRDAEGSHGMGVRLTGVWLSNVPLEGNEGAKGTALLEVQVAASLAELAEFECVEEDGEGPGYREW